MILPIIYLEDKQIFIVREEQLLLFLHQYHSNKLRGTKEIKRDYDWFRVKSVILRDCSCLHYNTAFLLKDLLVST